MNQIRSNRIRKFAFGHIKCFTGFWCFNRICWGICWENNWRETSAVVYLSAWCLFWELLTVWQTFRVWTHSWCLWGAVETDAFCWDCTAIWRRPTHEIFSRTWNHLSRISYFYCTVTAEAGVIYSLCWRANCSTLKLQTDVSVYEAVKPESMMCSPLRLKLLFLLLFANESMWHHEHVMIYHTFLCVTPPDQ